VEPQEVAIRVEVIRVAEYEVYAEFRVEGEIGALMMLPVPVRGCMGRRPMAAVRCAIERDRDTTAQCDGGHQKDRDEQAAHDRTPFAWGIGRCAEPLDTAV
jgi:hypothetical protein